MDYLHFLVTQFNLRFFPLADNTDYEKWLQWTLTRTELFRKYCLPSILNQSCRNFIWLLYFDADTPAELNDFIKYLSSLPSVEICYCRGISDFDSSYIQEIRKRTGKETKWIITTRIDNDDCLHKDAVKIIQENLVEKHRYLISLASGYVLNINDLTLSHYFYPMSPFISLIESCEKELEGVFVKVHTKWDNLRLFIFKELWLEWFNRKSRMSRFILKKPLWIQTVHGENISNSFYRGFPVLKEKDLSDFSIDYSTNKLPFKIIRNYLSYVTWKRYFKCLVIKTLLHK